MNVLDDKLIIVTGGAGFIGSCFIRYLNDLGHTKIVVVDDLGDGDKWKNLVGKKLYDVLHKGELFSWLQGRGSDISAIVHLGACSKTVEKNANYLLDNNYRYSQRLAKYAIDESIRFVYASSAATYGYGSEGFVDDESQLHRLEPLNMYGFSKQLFDLWLQRTNVLDKVVGLKFFNVFGPNEYHKDRMASAIFHMLPVVKKEGVVRLFKSSDKLYSDGGQKRDFIYVKDVVKMIYGFLIGKKTGIYNIGSGVASTWNELACSVFKAIDVPVNIEYTPMPADLHGKYQNYTCADMKKTRTVIEDIADCRPLEESVVEYVRDYLLTGKIW